MRSIILSAAICFILALNANAASDAYKGNIYNPGKIKATDSTTALKPGDSAPEFDLPAVSGGRVKLSDFRESKNVVLSFIPAAWTPVCSDQWPGYNIVQELFNENDAVLLGISVDNIPTLFAWTNQMGHLWFPVLSDFWPHGAVAKIYGILRTDGMAERAIFVINKKGIITYINVNDINTRPSLEDIVKGLEKANK